MDIKAKIEKIFPTHQVTGTFKKREFVVEFAENPQYPEYVKFECIQDKCDMLDNFSTGQEVTISFNLKGRKWTDPKNGEDRYFNTLQAWRINAESTAAPAPNGGGSTPPPPSANDEPDWLSEDSDDLPF
jgi:single-stranded DNA-binding protein